MQYLGRQFAGSSELPVWPSVCAGAPASLSANERIGHPHFTLFTTQPFGRCTGIGPGDTVSEQIPIQVGGMVIRLSASRRARLVELAVVSPTGKPRRGDRIPQSRPIEIPDL
jgi:hypothetical protein